MSGSTAPPAHITSDMFAEWKAAKRGTNNPTQMNNPVWTWLIESRISAYQADRLFSEASTDLEAPGWSFDRFGQSTTALPDGRVALTAGEHEDYYDSDFFIYNDLVLINPQGPPDIFCYPLDDFPATDFHSSSLVDNSIIMVGNLGYQDSRRAGYTQVLQLDVETLQVSRRETSGDNPAWIHNHQATLTEDRKGIIVSGGLIDACNDSPLFENIDEWKLDLTSWRWERLTNKAWPRFEVYRSDQRRNHLWELRHLQWAQKTGWHDLEEKEAELTAELGSRPNLDELPTLYTPSIAEKVLSEQSDEHNVHRILLSGATVRYVEHHGVIQVTIEGDLPADKIDALKQDLVAKLEKLEQTKCQCRIIPGL